MRPFHDPVENYAGFVNRGRENPIQTTLSTFSERKCPFCHSIEDETHFLIVCTNYVPLRNEFLKSVQEKLKEVKIEKLDDKTLLKYLLGNIKIAPIVAKYLKRTMELRNFLIDSPRRIL